MDKIKGYRELTEEDISKINVVKNLGDEIGQLIATMSKDEKVDQRWLAIGLTDLQKGIMAVTRAIAKPEGF